MTPSLLSTQSVPTTIPFPSPYIYPPIPPFQFQFPQLIPFPQLNFNSKPILSNISNSHLLMADEFQESELFFSECDSTGSSETEHSGSESESWESNTNNCKLKRNKSRSINGRNSAPVNIENGISWIQYDVERDFDDDFDYGDGEMVPPHVIIRRRVAGKMAFSVCSGNGRTLKGRDLSQVRNSILRMTGFLEA